MIIKLYHRHYGIHSLVKAVEIKGGFSDYCKKNPNANNYNDKYIIAEERLIENLPPDLLPNKPQATLLTVGNERGSTGLYNVNVFMVWAKYFDSYVLELFEEDGAE